MMLVGPCVALLLLAWTGALQGQEVAGLPDPGQLTRYGLPIVQALRDIGAGLTVGALAIAATCLASKDGGGNQVSGAQRALLELVVVSASTWMWTSLLLVGLAQSDASGAPVTSPGFLGQSVFFAQSYEVGRYLVISAALAAVVAVGALGTSRLTGIGVLFALALAGMWPMALAGHAAGTLNHDDTVNLQAMHLVGVALWSGGLVSLVVVRRRLADAALLAATHRFSTLAGWCLAVVAVSGVLGALVRLPDLSLVFSPYGGMLAIKVAAVAALAGMGWWQRRVGLVRLEQGRPGAFTRMVAIEIVVLAAAAGTGVALSRTDPPSPPGPERSLSPAESLLGHELPRALGASEWFTQWRPDTFWLPVALALLVWYGLAVARLRARGDAWPLWRTVAWLAGWLLFIWATSGAPGAYGRVLFSMHMVQHMTVALAVPTFLALGAPVTLALRTMPRRADASMGPREWLLRIVHSGPARIVGSPIVAAALVIVSLVTFYYSSIFELSLRTHTMHLLMTTHFLATGYLFANCLVGSDPGPRRPPYPLRVLMILVTFGFHALFSVSLMASSQVLAREWFETLDRPWGASLEDDQYLGASLGWALGDYPLAILAVALVASWVHADRRERRRLDRKADRDGDDERTKYNEYLTRISGSASTDSPQGRAGTVTSPASGVDRES